MINLLILIIYYLMTIITMTIIMIIYISANNNDLQKQIDYIKSKAFRDNIQYIKKESLTNILQSNECKKCSFNTEKYYIIIQKCKKKSKSL